MGKKLGSKKRTVDDADLEAEQIEDDDELQAEIAAVMAARKEKQQSDTSPEDDKGDDNEDYDKNKMYNKDGMLKCIEDLDQSLPFLETMVVNEFTAPVMDENDDIEREMAFYNQTLSAVVEGRRRLQQLGIPVRRPDDYFCENVKSDAHMAKIKDKLLIEDQRIEAFESRKKREQNRKFNKQVSDLRKQEKTQSKKQHIKDVTNLRNDAESTAGSKEERLKQLLEGGGAGGKGGANGSTGGKPEKSKKRINIDKKYGFGGAERKRAKLNDKKSLNDFSDFNPRGGSVIRRAGAGKGSSSGRGGGARGRAGAGGGGATGKRPGKDARNKKRASR